MKSGFNKLTESEKELMLKAPVLACILVGGADGKLDESEIKGAIKVAESKQIESHPDILEFYQLVGEDFEDKLKVLIQSYPKKVKERNAVIEQELSGLNSIFPKLDKPFVLEFYHGLKEMALTIAEASGGLFGINKVGVEEEKFVGLGMIKDPSH